MFKKIKSKKGAALEMAIAAILVMYTICFIMYIVSFKDRVRNNYQNNNFDQPNTVESIGEYFLLYCKKDIGQSFTYSVDGYHTEVNKLEDNILELIVKDKELEDEIVLIVQVDDTTDTIIKWYFNNTLNNTTNKIFDAS